MRFRPFTGVDGARGGGRKRDPGKLRPRGGRRIRLGGARWGFIPRRSFTRYADARRARWKHMAPIGPADLGGFAQNSRGANQSAHIARRNPPAGRNWRRNFLARGTVAIQKEADCLPQNTENGDIARAAHRGRHVRRRAIHRCEAHIANMLYVSFLSRRSAPPTQQLDRKPPPGTLAGPKGKAPSATDGRSKRQGRESGSFRISAPASPSVEATAPEAEGAYGARNSPRRPASFAGITGTSAGWDISAALKIVEANGVYPRDDARNFPPVF